MVNKKNRYYNVFIKVIVLIVVFKIMENYIVLFVKVIIVIVFGVLFKFGLFFNLEIYLINKIFFKNWRKLMNFYIFYIYIYGCLIYIFCGFIMLIW